jgi:D-tyrosyl-tRNA(Tyr) deacylase
MKFVIQRVNSASVKVGSDVVGSIGRGLLVLIGLTHNDKYSDIEFTTNKLLNIRLFDDDKGNRWKESVKSLDLEILLVSQFTLYSILKGNKPDFHNALGPDEALKMYNIFLETLSKKHPDKVQSGKFGEHMEVSLVNDGPVTINWEYPEFQDYKKEEKVETKQNTQIKQNKQTLENKETNQISLNKDKNI